MKRIVFTQKELDALLALVDIAEAGTDDGDYKDFDFAAMEIAASKLSVLLKRIKAKKVVM